VWVVGESRPAVQDAGPLSMSSAGKVLPTYPGKSSNIAVDAAAGQGSASQLRYTTEAQPLIRAVSHADPYAPKSFGAFPTSSVGREVSAAVSNLVKLVEPSRGGGGDDVSQTQRTVTARLTDVVQQAPSGVERDEVVGAEVNVCVNAEVVAIVRDSPAHADVLSSSVDTTKLSSVRLVTAANVLATATVTASEPPSGMTIPTLSTATPVSASTSSSLSGQSAAASKLFGVPSGVSGSSTGGLSSEQQPAAGSSGPVSDQAGVMVLTSGSAVLAEISSATQPMSAMPTATQPMPSAGSVESEPSVIGTWSENTAAQSTGAVVTTVPTGAAVTVSGQSAAAGPAVMFTQLSSAEPAGNVAAATAALAANSATVSTSAVFGQTASTAAAAAAGMPVFAGTSCTTSSSPVFGMTSATTSATVFGQSSVSSAPFAQQTSTTPASAAAVASSINIFAQPAVSVSSSTGLPAFGGVFGQQTSSTSGTGGFKPFGFAASSTATFGQTPSFAHSTFGQSAFGQPTSRFV